MKAISRIILTSGAVLYALTCLLHRYLLPPGSDTRWFATFCFAMIALLALQTYLLRDDQELVRKPSQSRALFSYGALVLAFALSLLINAGALAERFVLFVWVNGFLFLVLCRFWSDKFLRLVFLISLPVYAVCAPSFENDNVYISTLLPGAMFGLGIFPILELAFFLALGAVGYICFYCKSVLVVLPLTLAALMRRSVALIWIGLGAAGLAFAVFSRGIRSFSLQERDLFARAALNVFESAPLFGAGMGSLPIVGGREYSHYHSMLGSVAAWAGLCGLAALAFLVSAFLRSFPTLPRWAKAVCVMYLLWGLFDDPLVWMSCNIVFVAAFSRVDSTSETRAVEKAGTGRPVVWLLQDGEPLPTDEQPQTLRTARLARALVEAGARVIWFASRFDHGKKEFRKSKLQTVSWLEYCDIVLLDGCGYRRNISAKRVIHQLITADNFRRHAETLSRPAVILGSYPTPELCFEGGKLARELGVPFAMDVRDPWPDTIAEHGLSKQILGFPLIVLYGIYLTQSLRIATAVVAMSEHMLRWALQKAGRPKQPLDHVFYIGSDVTPRAVVGGVPRFTAEQPLRCVFYGMFGKAQNGELLIDAVKTLAAESENRVELVMVGDGESRAAWEERAKSCANIRFAGWLGKQEAEALFSGCHVGLVGIKGSVNEIWFGNKFFEYLGTGLPVIADVGGELRQCIIENEVGIAVPMNDVGAFAAALRSYVNDPGMYRTHRENALRLFDERFAQDKIYPRFANHLLALRKQD